MLEFEEKNSLKKVLIYGEDGSGKSTFAEEYCKKNNLKAVCIDVEKTNFTSIPIVKCDLGNDKKAVRNIVSVIKQLKDSDYDTLILDGASTLLEILVSDAKGLAKYSDRATNFQKILMATLNSGLNVIFIGQIDMEVIHNQDTQSNKQIIKINSLVNEKYLTIKTGDGDNAKYDYIVKKYRVINNGSK